MQKQFEINRTKIKHGCQSGRKGLTQNFKSDLPLDGHKSTWQNFANRTHCHLLVRKNINYLFKRPTGWCTAEETAEFSAAEEPEAVLP